jgi:hypothetical protein
MASPVSLVNQALSLIGQQVQIFSFDDNTPAAKAASLNYTQVVQMVMRSAPWDRLRAQIALTQLRATVINGVTTDDPPPAPWNFEYAYPSDCLKARFLQPTPLPVEAGVPLTTAPNAALAVSGLPTNIPFVVGTDKDAGGNPISIILTQLPQAQLIYNRDLSQVPDLWDSLLTSGVIATLGAYLINALARDSAQMTQQIGMAKNILDTARAASANESISNADHSPDWINIRMAGSVAWGWNRGGPNGVVESWAGTCAFPDGQWY